MEKVVLITGASSGMGESTAMQLSEKGYKVYGAARNVNKMKKLEDYGISIIPLDITNDTSIVECVNTILKREGRIDILINNAGYGSLGAIEDVSIEEAKHQFKVNIFGLARITQLVLPSMRKNKYGRIINMSSIAGKIYSLFGGWYNASKHALEGLSDCLRIETKPFGIDVVIIEPGIINTPWSGIATKNLRNVSGKGAYSKMANKIATYMDKQYSTGTTPDVLARTIVKAAIAKNPRTRYVAGAMSKPTVFLRKWLSDKLFDRIITSLG